MASVATAQQYFWGTGRRKTAVARVRLSEGTGQIRINGRGLEEYFTEPKDRRAVLVPMELTGTLGKVDLLVNANGGGFTGQGGALMLGVARALRKYRPDLDKALRDAGLLSRDSRMKERKKYGHKGARKSFQFSKR